MFTAIVDYIKSWWFTAESNETLPKETDGCKITTTATEEYDYVEVQIAEGYVDKQRRLFRDRVTAICQSTYEGVPVSQLTTEQKMQISSVLEQEEQDNEMFTCLCVNCCDYISGYDDAFYYKCEEERHNFCETCFLSLGMHVKHSVEDEDYEDYDEYLIVDCPLCE